MVNPGRPWRELGFFIFISLLLGVVADWFVGGTCGNYTSRPSALMCIPLASSSCIQGKGAPSWDPMSTWWRVEKCRMSSSEWGPSSTSNSPAASKLMTSSGSHLRESKSETQGTGGLRHRHGYVCLKLPGWWEWTSTVEDHSYWNYSHEMNKEGSPESYLVRWL